MTRLGMVVRCDQGGLGNQTHELWRHLKPEVTVLVDLPRAKSRGAGEPSKYDADWTTIRRVDDDVITEPQLREIARDVDVILTVENLYSGQRGFDVVREENARTVLVANPELYGGYPADTIVVPTPWELQRMPRGTEVLPHPVAEPPANLKRQRRVCQTFLHVAAPAMLDRNGTDTVVDALSYVTHPCQLVVHAPFRHPPWDKKATTEVSSHTIGKVDVRWDPRPKRRYWDVYDVETDVLLLPRRYGGLCMPVQEAAACGLPAVMTDIPPQVWWPVTRVRARHKTSYGMRGGHFKIYDTRPRDLASTMDDLVSGNRDVETMSSEASEWARSISWDELRPRWQALCE